MPENTERERAHGHAKNQSRGCSNRQYLVTENLCREQQILRENNQGSEIKVASVKTVPFDSNDLDPSPLYDSGSWTLSVAGLRFW